MDQIKNSPEIAPSDLSELMESVAAAENPETAAGVLAVLNPRPAVKKTAVTSPVSKSVPVTAATVNSAPPVLKRPVKLSDGTPLKRDKLPAVAVTPIAGSGDAGAKRRASKRSHEDDTAGMVYRMISYKKNCIEPRCI